MNNTDIIGLHHVTAISGPPAKNVRFYRDVLGQRLVKQTVNFDDPYTYHLYYGDGAAAPGTILTFFPWEGVRQGTVGPRQAVATAYAVAASSLGWWRDRLRAAQVKVEELPPRFGQPVLRVLDPDGLVIELIGVPTAPGNPSWPGDPIPAEHRLGSFHSVTGMVHQFGPTRRVLEEVLNHRVIGEEGGRMRLASADGYGVFDLVGANQTGWGHGGAGTVHHVAFRVPDDATHRRVRERARAAGLNVTDVIDRQYFHSIYFREPGGILFEVATDNPGFTVNEPLERLGQTLQLPPQYEHLREELRRTLPLLT